MNIASISLDNLKRAIALKEQISVLENELKSILDSNSEGNPTAPSRFKAGRGRRGRKPGRPAKKASGRTAFGVRKGKISEEGRRRIAEAQKRRWAKLKAAAKSSADVASSQNISTDKADKPAARKVVKRKISAEGRARIVEAAKARWAAFRSARKRSN